jgi:integrase/recombinase XerD
MQIQRIKISNIKFSWLVLGNNCLPVKPIQEFIRFLDNVARSPNTVRAYANHLKLYWEYLDFIKKDWKDVKLNDFADFLSWLRQQSTNNVISLTIQESKRTESTIGSILAAVSSFYNFQQQLGNTDIVLNQSSTVRHRRYKPLLHHISKNKPIRTSLIKLKIQKVLPKTLTQEQVKSVINACNSLRDQFLILLLYESGLRIGQALGLRHSDIKSWDNEIHIQPRLNNVNQARSKSNLPNVIHITSQLMALYSRYLLEEFDDHHSDFVFIQTSKNHTPGKPWNYRAVRDLFSRLSQKVGFYISPHMLRHTHATELLRNGWDCSYIQKRLGHSSIQTTINTYAHLSNDDLKKAFQEYLKTRT